MLLLRQFNKKSQSVIYSRFHCMEIPWDFTLLIKLVSVLLHICSVLCLINSNGYNLKRCYTTNAFVSSGNRPMLISLTSLNKRSLISPEKEKSDSSFSSFMKLHWCPCTGICLLYHLPSCQTFFKKTPISTNSPYTINLSYQST